VRLNPSKNCTLPDQLHRSSEAVNHLSDMIVQTVQIFIFSVDKNGLGGLLTAFIDILIPVLFQKTVCQEGVNVC
jgi:hypothetical protein